MNLREWRCGNGDNAHWSNHAYRAIRMPQSQLPSFTLSSIASSVTFRWSPLLNWSVSLPAVQQGKLSCNRAAHALLHSSPFPTLWCDHYCRVGKDKVYVDPLAEHIYNNSNSYLQPQALPVEILKILEERFYTNVKLQSKVNTKMPVIPHKTTITPPETHKRKCMTSTPRK